MGHQMPERVAVLVIHGIGQQRPYETLDQFTLGLLASFDKQLTPWSLQPRLEICKDPLHEQQQWVRASCVLRPSDTQRPPQFLSDQSRTIGEISLFEYYWAPITQDKISYFGSLVFLIKAGLTPFKYLAANLTVLAAIGNRKRIPIIVLKELWRQACLFLPLIALFVFLLAFLSAQRPVKFLALFGATPAETMLLIGILAVRYLYIWTIGAALLSSLEAKSTWQASKKWRLVLAGALAGHIVLWPLWISPVLRGIASCFSSIARHASLLSLLLDHWSGVIRNLADQTKLPHGLGGWAWFRTLVFLKPTFSHPHYISVPLWLLLAYFVRFILINYVGDVAVYVNANELSKNFQAREQILDECTGALSQILRQRTNPLDSTSPYVYDRVLIAAHSLGSVIAYDTINELLNRVRTSNPANPKALQPEDLEKLRGMATFGCPLNKIFYFFRERIRPAQELRRQIIDLLHGFRVQPSLLTYPPTSAGPAGPMAPNPDPRWALAEQRLKSGFRWINAYALADPVSGRLSFYDLGEPENQKLFWYWKFGLAHLSYWTDGDFYQFFRERLL
jgi:hypothetical protein